MSNRVSDRLTKQDRAIYDCMPLVGRLMVHRDRNDAEIMLARVCAKGRGANPVEVQANVEKLSTYEFPETYRKGFSPAVHVIGRHSDYAQGEAA